MRRLVSGAAVSLLLAVPSVAEGAWVQIDPPFADPDATGLALAADPTGSLAYASARTASGVQQHRVRRRAEAFGAPFTGPAGTEASIDAFGFDQVGNAVFTSATSGSVLGAHRARGAAGAFGPTSTLGRRTAAPAPAPVSVNQGGAALAAWVDDQGRLVTSDRPSGAGSAFAPPQPTGVTGLSGSDGIVLPVMDDWDGSAVVLYERGGAISQVVRAPGGQAFTPGPDLVTDRSGSAIVTATNAQGDAVVAWADGQTVYAATRNNLGFHDPEVVDDDADRGQLAGSALAAAVVRGGSVVLGVIRRSEAACEAGGGFSVRLVTGRFRSFTRVERFPIGDGRLTLAGSPDDEGFLAAYPRSAASLADGGRECGGTDERRVVVGAGRQGSFDPRAVEVLPGQSGINLPGPLVLDRAGNATALWSATGPNAGQRAAVLDQPDDGIPLIVGSTQVGGRPISPPPPGNSGSTKPAPAPPEFSARARQTSTSARTPRSAPVELECRTPRCVIAVSGTLTVAGPRKAQRFRIAPRRYAVAAGRRRIRVKLPVRASRPIATGLRQRRRVVVSLRLASPTRPGSESVRVTLRRRARR